jgi:hypothetical protein
LLGLRVGTDGDSERSTAVPEMSEVSLALFLVRKRFIVAITAGYAPDFQA